MIAYDSGYEYGMKVVEYISKSGRRYSRRRKHILAYCDTCGRENWVRVDNANNLMERNVDNGLNQYEYHCAYCKPIGAKLDIPEI
jgi:hypothetical protein